ncbi:MAG TPA: HlyD family efflux transporter periplasmic adaptor subunit [Methylomirabilota bacterium]|nr:HlyD family efflux transporter periplasmic adaptor subunit [Methylomirabilota bacterium]
MSKIKGFINWFLIASWKKKALLIAVVLLVVWFAFSRVSAANKQKQQYQTAQVTKGEIISAVSESGSVAAGSQVSVGSPADGIIQEVSVKNGDTVSAGQNLFQVNATATPQEQASAYADYLSAQNNLNTAKSKMNSLQSALFKANQTFINDKGISNPSDQQKSDPTYIEENADWLQAEADYTNQQGVISQAQAALNNASLAYQATQNAIVTAPVGGTVANLSVLVGSSVSAVNNNTSNTNNSSATTTSSSSSTSSSPVLVIGDFSMLSIKAQVSEVDIPNVHVGQKATVTLDAFADKTFVGTVTSVDTIGTTSSGVVTYNVYISLVEPPATIQPGMTASVIIQTNRKEDVLQVPTSAIQTTNGTPTVRVLKNGQVTAVPVETGITSDSTTEITSGLSEGDTVVTSIVSQTSATGGSTGSSPFSGLGGGRGFGGGGGVVFRRGQ